jgi:hypothetical protein
MPYSYCPTPPLLGVKGGEKAPLVLPSPLVQEGKGCLQESLLVTVREKRKGEN